MPENRPDSRRKAIAMRPSSHRQAALIFALAFAAGCGQKGTSGHTGTAPAPTQRASAESPAPYRYAAPVKGGFHEVNIGKFDLADGIAYTAAGSPTTVVFATSKPIASPVLADSPCLVTHVRFLTELRDAGWVEVALNGKGRSDYFAAGQAFDGSSVERGGDPDWASRMTITGSGHASGAVEHRREGHFSFDLPVFHPVTAQATQAEAVEGQWSDDSAPRPAEAAVTAAYHAALEAAQHKDLKAMLAAQGFSEKQVAAIRGLDGIEADFAVYADRFLTPGTPGDFTPKPGTAYLRSEGTNSKGKKFANYYHFVPCGGGFVLAKIAENPQ